MIHKFSKVYCTKTKKMYSVEELERIPNDEFETIKRDLYCPNFISTINCQARISPKVRLRKPDPSLGIIRSIRSLTTYHRFQHVSSCEYSYEPSATKTTAIEVDPTKKELQEAMLSVLRLRARNKTSRSYKGVANEKIEPSVSSVLPIVQCSKTSIKFRRIKIINPLSDVSKDGNKHLLYGEVELQLTYSLTTSKPLTDKITGKNIFDKEGKERKTNFYHFSICIDGRELFWISFGTIQYELFMNEYEHLLDGKKHKGFLIIYTSIGKNKFTKDKMDSWINYPPDEFYFE